MKKIGRDNQRNFWMWVLRAAIIFLLLWQSYQLMTRPIHADEAEHAHVAYRMSRGDRPFVDFFEHHFPGLWYLLLPFYILGGYGAGVLFWGRIICIISLLLMVSLCYLIGKQIGPPLTGELAALIPLPFAIANEYLQVRPESVMLPLVLGGVYAAVRFLQKKEESKWLMIGFALVSLGLFFSPRSLVVLLWIGVIYVINFRRVSVTHHLLSIGTAALGPVILLRVVGWHDCYWWIYRFSLSLSPPFSLRYMLTLLSDKYVLTIGVVISLIALIRSTGSIRYISGLITVTVAFLIIHTTSGIRTPGYAWAIASVLSAIMFAYGFASLLFRRSAITNCMAMVLLLPWLVFSVCALNKPSLMLTSDGKKAIPNPASLSQEVGEMDGFCRRYENQGPAWIVWDFDVSFIPVQDVSYFWSAQCNIPVTLARAGIASPAPEWASDIRSKLPFVVSKSLLDKEWTGFDANQEWWDWFNSNYPLLKRPRGDYLYWRRDIQVSSKDIAQ